MDRKLGIWFECLADIRDGRPLEYRDVGAALRKIRDAGFESVFIEQNDVRKASAIRNEADRLGLALETIHAPYQGVNAFWQAGLDYLPLKEKIYMTIDCAAACGIPVVVLHVDSGWDPPQICDIGLERFDALVEYAQARGVKAAFENIRNFGTLAALIQRYRKLDSVGFCYDCGHEHCYTETVHFTELFGKKILCTHIHDNVGRGDRDDPDDHLVMFDGDIDYADMMRRLRAVGYEGTLTSEAMRRHPRYADMSGEEFLRLNYERLLKVSKL